MLDSAPSQIAFGLLALLAVAPGCADDSAKNDGSGGNGGSGSPTSAQNGPSTGSSAGEPAEMMGITAAHNAVRDGVSPAASPPMSGLTWDASIAAVAQAYADKCVFAHSQGDYGENLFATSGSASAQDVVSSWASEVSDYNYGSNSCSGVCGHYTQIVWANSLRLGCGVSNCNTGSPLGGGSWQNWVCNYDPPGNFVGQKPY